MLKPLILAAAIAATVSTVAYAKGPTDCPHIFGTNGQPHVATTAAPSRSSYASVDMPCRHPPPPARPYGPPNLTAQAVLAARDVPRDSDFYEETAIPATDRAHLSDYRRGTGLDRGHLAPSADFPDQASQAESFSLANVVPQASVSNRRLWSHLETSTRRMVRDYGQAFVVTGPAFDPAQPARLNSRVAIPTYLWKAVYVPGVGAAAYVARNDATPWYAVVSIAELANLAGVDPFPRLDRAYRETPMTLLAPTPHPGEKAGRKVSLTTLTAVAVDRSALPDAPEGQDARHPVLRSGALPFIRAVFARH
ncbi:DNA/RNA non-specific endonuclease [Cupriavidus sp. CuC1]|uniref:DNA/RNA non-specific endonuclease n=1 Tax=Cupriavidus sp. CuC1 TaxID=3373131 RepID=UPI0037D3A264